MFGKHFRKGCEMCVRGSVNSEIFSKGNLNIQPQKKTEIKWRKCAAMAGL